MNNKITILGLELSYPDLIVMLSGCIIFGGLSIYLGQDVNWDLKNYHFYNSYAALNERIGYDYFPGQMQNFHNPVIHIPIYWMIKFMKPIYVGFILGAIQGFNLFLVYLISRSIFQKVTIKFYPIICLLMTIVGVASPIFLSEIGVTMGDNLSSLPILMGILLLVLQEGNETQNKSCFFVSGMFLGISAGLKITNLIYGMAVFLALSILFILKKRKDTLTFIIFLCLFLLGLFLGFILVSGYWLILMIRNYDNPLFPYYNSIFKSPYFAPVNFKDGRWLPQGFMDIIYYPLSWSRTRQHPSLELTFRDLRWIVILFLYAIAVINGLYLKFKSSHLLDKTNVMELNKNTQLFNKNSSLFLLVFSALSFIIWLFMFGYSRYLIPLDLLSGIIIFCLVYTLYYPRKLKLVTAIVLSSLILFTIKTPNWGRLPWSDSWFGVNIPVAVQNKKMLVIMLTNEPISYVIPFFPKSTRFVRVEGNFSEYIKGSLSQQDLESVIREYEGSFFALTPKVSKLGESQTNLGHYDLMISQPMECFKIISRIETLHLCSLSRKNSTQQND